MKLTYTPRNGRWPKVAEGELSVLSRQCLDRRVGDGATLEREVRAWTERRNREASTVTWQFTTADARVKRKRLYPPAEV